jgi:hypothetical protein
MYRNSQDDSLIDLIWEILFVLGMIYLLHIATADKEPPQQSPQPEERNDDPEDLNDPDLGLMATAIDFTFDRKERLWCFHVWATREDGQIIIIDSDSPHKKLPEDVGLLGLLQWLEQLSEENGYFLPPTDLLLKASWSRHATKQEISFVWESLTDGRPYERVIA